MLLVIKKISNWKVFGKDKIINFWIKNLYVLYEDFLKGCNEIMKNLKICFVWFIDEGIIYLFFKFEDIKYL